MKTETEALITISFRHPYYKLAREEFTTVRGKTQFKRLKVGQQIAIETPAENFLTEVTALVLCRVDQMSLEFLKADAEWPGCTISRHEHFVNLLNSFRAPLWAKVTLESELTIITLRRLGNMV